MENFICQFWKMIYFFIHGLILAVILCIQLKRKRNRGRNWEDDTVIVIGGCGAIGSALVNQFRALKVGKVITVDIKPEADIQCNVADPEQVANLLRAVLEKSTILVNAVGLVHARPLVQLSCREIEESVKVNLLSYLYTCHEFLKCLTTFPQENTSYQPRYIVNLSSCLGLGGVANMTDYCATKFAVFGFSESLRNELASMKNSKVKVLTVCPFLVEDSEMFKDKVRIKFPRLTRPLEKAYLAERIVQAILEEKTELWLPWWVNFIGLLRIIPTAWFDRLQVMLGSSDAILLQKKY